MRTKSWVTALVLASAGSAAVAALTGDNSIKGVTEDGKKVVLRADGTWRYQADVGATLGLRLHEKPPSATAVYQTPVPQFQVMYDPSLWTTRSDRDKPDRQSFVHKTGALFATVLAEPLPLTSDEVKKLAIHNFSNGAPGGQVVLEEQRVVNGLQVNTLQMTGSPGGVAFTLYGNYYGSERGSIQVMCWTVKSAFATYEADCLNFINGLIAKR
ncbi:hypothetical protein [Eleftheria terrae]|uniref:hypothetical protein n=1 Tax=Eleftheria terrae TaxID=1597781 RepID=UPI00263AC8DB|nr:hypothetical protein [Eleftheria terrae]WKB53180.1 hypothetical protein N7L95_01890 [Eleftheria terrae]